jgi:hypothetical protein
MKNAKRLPRDTLDIPVVERRGRLGDVTIMIIIVIDELG